MLEPLFQCNLECAGCGKIAYENDVLRQRLTVDECLARDECGAPWCRFRREPLIHTDMPKIVRGSSRERSSCTSHERDPVCQTTR